VRVTLAGAWGGDADLVSAIVPFGGMILPRHWGHWRSEAVLGAEWRARGLRVRAALSMREPVDLYQAAAPQVIWVEGQWVW
jgi:hypothetical protein